MLSSYFSLFFPAPLVFKYPMLLDSPSFISSLFKFQLSIFYSKVHTLQGPGATRGRELCSEAIFADRMGR